MKYTLMNKNIAVLEFESEPETIYATRMGEVFAEEYAPLSITIDDGIADRAAFNSWLMHRRIPLDRQQLAGSLENLVTSAGKNISTSVLAEKSFYLSLSDQYWIKPERSELCWADINFFRNSFSKLCLTEKPSAILY